MSAESASIGRDGENVTANWYIRAGFVIEARNWSCREGELDIVAVRPAGPAQRQLTVICEVKTRSSTRFGSGAEAVGTQKQRRIRAATRHYLHQRGTPSGQVRFDVAVLQRGPHGYAIEVHEGAF